MHPSVPSVTAVVKLSTQALTTADTENTEGGTEKIEIRTLPKEEIIYSLIHLFIESMSK